MIKQQQVFVEENMPNLTSAAASGDPSVPSSNNINRGGESSSSIYTPQHYYSQPHDQSQDLDDPQQPPPKKKRNLPGNPDPDAEVIAMSPKSLLATNRFVCEICNKGFQRDQNLQLHRRGHNLPWKLKQRTNKEVRKKVYVCPEESCVHHDPSRALGDLTGIKKHFCRKHGEKKWKCDKCSKRYAVQSDWKAHSKVCGTREYRCDCGTLFSRRDSFITHRAFCDALAEETARAITPNSLFSTPVAVGGPSSSHFINLQQQEQQQAVQFNNQQDPLHAFPLKREQHQQQQPNLMISQLPPWLVCPPSSIEHHQRPHLSSPSPSSSSSIFHQDHQLMQQDQNQNPSMGPTSSMRFPSVGGGAYHTQLASSGPHMSATALLQKAAQMGATMSNTAQPQSQGHVSDTNSNTPTTTTTAGMFGLNLSSRDHPHHQEIILSSTSTRTNGLLVNHGLSSFGNKAATPPPTPNGTSGPGPSPSSSSSSFFHDMMINSLTSSYDNHDDAFGIGGMLGSSKKDPTLGNGNEGLTRDFLGLRPLSHSDILTIAALGNCMTTSTTSHDHQRSDGYP